MKSMKKLLALALVLIMVLSLAITANADPATYNVTINNDKSGHTYEAYQIFVGDLSGAAANDNVAGSNAVLSNIKWGNSITKYKDSNVSAGTDASAVITELKADLDVFLTELTLGTPVATTSIKTAENTYVLSNLAAGYYLIKDEDGTQDGKHDAHTSYIIEVVENSTVDPKISVPTVEKGIADIDVNATDAEIGETITFVLEGRLDANLDTYETYKVVFHDIISEGLTLAATKGDDNVITAGVSVKIGEKDVTSDFRITAVAAQVGEGEKTEDVTKLTVSCDDVKAQAVGATNNSVITVTYSATLNEKAKVGSEGNSNIVWLEYSNDPNFVPDGTTTPPTGETPPDEVLVFTYELDVVKVDGQTQEKLSGAEFALLNEAKTKYAVVENGILNEWKDVPAENEAWPADSKLVSGADGTFYIKGLSSEVYYLKEIKAPTGYNLLANPVKVEIKTTLNTADGQAEEKTLYIRVNDGIDEEGNVSNGTVNATVENNAGTTLPETGGMGTTIFYVIGGLLVAAAVVLLVTKKRMASAK